MSTVDLGVRVLLIDGFTSGFGGIASALGLFGSGLLSSGAKAASLEEKLSSLSGLARLAEADFAAGTITAAQYAERMDDISMQAAQASSKLDTMHQTMLGMSIAAGAGVDLAIFGGALKMVVGDAMDLQTTMNKMIVAIHGAKENFDGLQQTLITVANNSVFTMQEVGDAFSALGQRGQDATAIMNGVGQAAIYLAEATGAKATPAAELLGTTMQAFGAKADEAEAYASALTVAFENGLPATEKLSQAYSQTAGIAHELGIPIQSLTGVLDVLAQHIPNTSIAATGLAFMLSQLSDPTAKAQKELSDLSIITKNTTTPAFYQFRDALDAAASAANKTPVAFDGTLTSLQKMFTQAQQLGTVHTDKSFYQWATSVGILNSKLDDGSGKFAGMDNAIRLLGTALDTLPANERIAAITDLLTARSGKAGQVLLGPDWQNVLNQIDKIQQKASNPNTAKENAADKTGGLEAEIQKLQTSFHDLSATIGTPILQPLGQFFDIINQGIGTLTKGDKNFQQFLATFLVIGAGLSIVGVIVGLVVMAFTGLLGPIGIFLLIAAGVAVAIPIISVVFAALATHLGGMGSAFAPLTSAFSGIGFQIKSVLGPLLPELTSMIGRMVPPSQQFVTMVQSQMTPVIQSLAESFNNVRPAIVLIVSLIGGILLAALKGLITGFAAAAPFLGLVFGGIVRIIVGVVQLIVGIISFVVSLIAGIFLILTGHPEKAKAMIMGSLHTMMSGIINIVQGAGALIVGAFVGAFVLVTGFISGFVSGIIHFFQHLADVLVGHSIVPDMVKGIVNFIKGLPGAVLGFISGMVQGVIGFFGNMASGAMKAVTGLFQHTDTNMRQMRIQAEMHTLQMKDNTLKHFVEQQQKAILSEQQQAVEVVNQIKNCKDAHTRHMLEMKLQAIGHHIQMREQTIQHASQMHQQIVAKMAALKTESTQNTGDMKSQVIGAFGNLLSGAGAALGNVGKWFTDNIVTPITTNLTNLGKTLLTAGQNLMQMLGQGITNAVGLVTKPAADAANSIKKLLGFSSPTKEGPLSNSDTYMPNMMKMYAKGIVDHTPLVHGAIHQMALGMKPNMSLHGGQIHLPNHLSQSGYGSSGGSSTHLHVHVGSKEVADCVIDHVSGQLKMNNMTTAWR